MREMRLCCLGDVGVAQKSPILTFLYKLTTRSHTVASHPACIRAPSVKVGVEVWHTALQARRTMTCCDRSATTTKSTCSSCASRQYRPRHSPACKRNGSLSFVRLTTRQTRRLSCSAPRPISGKTQSLQRQNNVPAVFDDAVRAVLSSAPQAVTKMAKAMMSTR